MKHIFLLLTVVVIFSLRAENRWVHTLYTTDDGLSQNRVMDIEQDQKGFMWFATWDGLNRFDGKQFRLYKGVPGDPEGMDNNRLMSVQADGIGYLWLLTGNGEVYRFNPETEQFKRITYNPVTQYGLVKHPISRISIVSDDKVALISPMGSYLLRLNSDGTIGRSLFVNKENGKLSGNWIREVVSDGENEVWFLTHTGLTHYNYTLNQFQQYFHQEKNKEAFRCTMSWDDCRYFGTESGSVWYYNKKTNTFKGKRISLLSSVSGMCNVSGNKLMITTLGEGVYLTDLALQVLSHFTTETHPELGSNRVNGLYADKNGLIWLDTETDGFVFFDTKSNTLNHRTHPSTAVLPNVRSVIRVMEGNKDYNWLYAQSGGLFAFDRASKEIEALTIIGDALGPENLQLLTDAMVDKDGNLWISSGEPRLEKITVENQKFVYTPVASIDKQKNGSEVRTLFEDKRNRIWVCDKEGKIQLMDENQHTLGWLKTDGTLSSTVNKTDLMVYDMIQDKKGRIWMACKGVGVVLLQEKKGKTPTFSLRYLNRETNAASRPNSTLCYDVLEDQQGRIWIGTFGGGLNLVQEANNVFTVLHSGNGLKTYPRKDFSNIRDMAVDKKGIIWVATDNGLVAFDSSIEDPSTIAYFTYRRNGSDPGSLRTNDIHCIYVDLHNNRWFGTFGGGLNVLDGNLGLGEKANFRSFTQKEGLPSDIVLSIEVDFQGYLWLFSENSITRFDSRTFDTDVYNKDYGLDPVMFAESPTLISHKGDMYAGTMKGYYRFDPSTVKKATDTPPLYFTAFFLFDKELTPNSSGDILTQNIDKVDRIVLKKEQSVFSIEFAALDFKNPQNIQYAYKLEPVDTDWIPINKSNRITLSRLTAGEYTLVVRSTNSEGVWMNNERRLKLVIKPSAWQTGWAITLYSIVVLIMLLFLHRFTLDKLKSKSKDSVDKKVIEAKRLFFSNVTQELRVPLMLIEGPIQEISKDEGLSSDSKNYVSIVQRNIDRMMRLINRILDFQKNMDRKMTLMVEELPLGELCRKTTDHFSTVAQERDISLLFSDRSNGVEVYVDKEKFDTILHILLSNAIKFTKGGCKISLDVYIDKQGIVIAVTDEGIGISKENLPYVFDRLNIAEKNDLESGIGVGLSLAKELVELHGGSIHVSSQEGVGSTFELHFKQGKNHFSETGVVFIQPEFYPGEIPTNESQVCMDQEQQNLLARQELFAVVEDPVNVELSIASCLSNHYQVAVFQNLPVDLEHIDRLMPDFMIIDHDHSTDGGMSLVRQIKENERTCHIPVIMVAERLVESFSPTLVLDGVFEVITKPFNSLYLEARMEHVLLHRLEILENLRKDMLDATSRTFATTLPIEPFDIGFLSRISDFLKDNISNSELTSDVVISFIGLGKSAFVGKLKGLLGLSANELIREFRLRRAIELLESGRFNVSEVVLQVGMKDVNTFNSCFKQHVGISPNEYRNKAVTH